MGKELVVIGGGVGGLSAAIYARLAGHSVCLLESGDRLGGKAAEVRIGGYRLDPGPSIVILTRIYESLFRDAGRRMQEYISFARLDPISRVYFGSEAPIDLPANRDECERLVDSLCTADGERFRRLMQKLDRVGPLVDRSIFSHPIDQPWQLLDRNLLQIGMHIDMRHSYKHLIDERFESPLLRAFFYGFPSYGGQTYDSKSPGALLIPYLMIQEGVFYPDGGVAAIPKALTKLAIELGVEIRTHSKVIGMASNWKTVKSVRMADGSAVNGEAFISGVDRLTTRSWLGHSANLKPSFSYFTIHWGIRRKVSGLRHHTLLIPKRFEDGFEALYRQRKFPLPPIVYLNEATVSDPAAAPEGCSNLFAVVTSPAEEPGLDWAIESDHARSAVTKVLADFGISISAGEIDFERIQTPATFAEAHGNYKGSLYGPDEKHRLFGMFPLRNRDEQYRNLFYCGGSVQPGAGLPMVILSGKFAAALV